jgi:hypothetical protein
MKGFGLRFRPFPFMILVLWIGFYLAKQFLQAQLDNVSEAWNPDDRQVIMKLEG